MRAVLIPLSALACTPTPAVDPDDTADPVPWVAPDAPGPYDVGVSTHVVSRDDGLPLTVEVWYPADVDEDDVITPYHPTFAFEGDAFRDADAVAGDYPVVAFSHGFGGVRYQSVFLTEYLASHGFVVVAPDHPLNNLLELHPDETANAAARRPGDVSATLDWWLETGAAELGVGVREDAIGVAGHSFGALTSLVVGGGRWDVDTLEAHCDNEGGTVCNFIEGQVVDRDLVASQGQPDPRVRATVALAPGGWYVFGEGGLDEVAAPLMLAGTRDVDLPYEREARPTWEATAGATLGTLADAGHWAFSDMCALLPLEDCAGASGGFMEPARVVEITTSRATAHFRVHLLGDVDAEPWLAGDVDLSWEIR